MLLNKPRPATDAVMTDTPFRLQWIVSRQRGKLKVANDANQTVFILIHKKISAIATHLNLNTTEL